MKKLVYFLALGALLIPAACSKNGEGGSGSSNKEFPKPSTKDYALVLQLGSDQVLTEFPGESISQPVEEIDFTEDGQALVFGQKSTRAAMVPIIKRPFKIAEYTVTPSTSDPGYNEYVVPTVGRFLISVADKKVKYSLASKAQIWVEIPVLELKKMITSGVADGNIARTWTVTGIIITVKGGSLGSAGIKKEFSSGCDIYEIAGWAKGQGVKISEEDYAALNGYKVSKVILTGGKHFGIEFAGAKAKPYFGIWSLSGSNFSYTLQNMEYDIMGTVTGSFSTDADSKTGQIKGSGKFTAAGAEYTGEVEIRLRAK